jgi:hypothetical protein
MPPMLRKTDPDVISVYYTQPTYLRWVNPLTGPAIYRSEDFPTVGGGAVPSGDAEVFQRSIWSTTVFDRKPDQGGAPNDLPAAYPLRNVSGDVMIQIRRPEDGAVRDITERLRVTLVSFCSARNSRDLRAVSRYQEVTQAFYNGARDTSFSTTWRTGHRFYQTYLVFDLLEDTTPPPLIVTASVT